MFRPACRKEDGCDPARLSREDVHKLLLGWDDDDVGLGIKTIHLHQQLVESLFSFIVCAA